VVTEQKLYENKKFLNLLNDCQQLEIIYLHNEGVHLALSWSTNQAVSKSLVI